MFHLRNFTIGQQTTVVNGIENTRIGSGNFPKHFEEKKHKSMNVWMCVSVVDQKYANDDDDCLVPMMIVQMGEHWGGLDEDLMRVIDQTIND